MKILVFNPNEITKIQREKILKAYKLPSKYWKLPLKCPHLYFRWIIS